jgi:hypothetical protein
MKLFEDMQELGDSVTEALRKMIVNMFGVEVSESEIAEVTEKLKISDLLILDQAYTNNDKNAAARILGKDIQLEYSMGGRGDVNSSATTRPAPTRRGTSTNTGGDEKGGNGTQATRNYSGGVQNGVATKNIDSEDDPDAVMTDDPLEEWSNSVGVERTGVEPDEDVWEEIAKIRDLLVRKKGYNPIKALTAAAKKVGVDTVDLEEWIMNNTDNTWTAEWEWMDAQERKHGALMPRIEAELEEAGVGAPDYNPARGGYNRDDDEEDEIKIGEVITHDHYGDVTVIEVADEDLYGGAASYMVQLPDGSTMEMSYDYLLGATDENEIGEAGAPDYNPARGGYNRDDEEDTQYAVINYPDTSISYIIRRPHDDWEHIYDPSYGYEGPVGDMDLEMARPLDHEEVPMRLRESNVIDMIAYLKRLSGIK